MSLTDDDQAAPSAVAGKQAPQGDASPAKPGVGAPSPKKTGAPNSKPIDADDTYVYRDFATMPAPSTGGAPVHPNSLQAQKLPAKLATMLSDQDLMSVIVWLPHGRSWRVLNRDLFAEHALPRYFGHKNYASFVRIVNAWGFRRVTRGPDRDSYYHELFLRGRPDLHQRMKRLSNAHRKTPVGKDDKCPDFYLLAKTSPLPETLFQRHGVTAMPAAQPSAAQLSQLLAGGGMMGHGQLQMPSMLSLMASATNNAASLNGMNPMNAVPAANANAQSAFAQLQRNNEDLQRRIMDLEGAKNQMQSPAAVPNQLAGGGGTAGEMLQRMMNSNAPAGNSSQSLLASLGANPNAGNEQYSFMPPSSHQDMILRAMSSMNQMPQMQPQQGLTAASLERVVPPSMMPSTGTDPVADDGKKSVVSDP
ncbi:hypothetical protein ACHAXT_009162 [Thalassiosira profunda]